MRSPSYRTIQSYLPLVIAVLSLLYAFGDYTGWWDALRGRTLATSAMHRLSSPEGYPKIIIFSDELEFRPLLRFILARTWSNEAKQRFGRGESPTAIVRMGGTLNPDLGAPLPAGWPAGRFAPDSSPVAFAVGHTAGRTLGDKNTVVPVATLGDVREWISASREQERFLVSTIFIGLLSIFLVIWDLRRTSER